MITLTNYHDLVPTQKSKAKFQPNNLNLPQNGICSQIPDSQTAFDDPGAMVKFDPRTFGCRATLITTTARCYNDGGTLSNGR